jgi:hypothetical protein
MRRGVATDEGAGWAVTTHDGIAEATFHIAADGARRCYALGFVLEAAEPIELQLRLHGEERETAAEQVRVKLTRATTYAGVVELDPYPRLASEVTIRLLSQGEGPTIFDLFLISYG